MKISVKADDGCIMFSYDTDKDSMCLHPAQAETPKVVEALREAVLYLTLSQPLTPAS